MYVGIPTSDDSLTITTEAAILDKGWRVKIEPKEKHIIPFTVTILDRPPLSKCVLFLLAFFALCIAAILGGVFLRFYVEYSIQEYLDYPQTNCTVLAINSTSDANGRYDVLISYHDEKNIAHNYTDSITHTEFISQNWSVGLVYVCLYKGDFVESYDSIYHQYTLVISMWYLGIIIPVGALLLFALPTSLRLLLVERNSTTCYYPRLTSYLDDQEFVISSWSTVGSELRNFFYLLLLTYYCNGEPSARSIAITDVSSNRRPALAYVMIFIFGSAPLLLAALGIYEMRGYEYVSYICGLILFCAGISIFPLSLYVIQKYFWPQRNFVETCELFIQYSVNENSMKGWIAIKDKN